MKISWNDKFIAYLTLLSGLTISAVAVYYSVAGLVSIFAAAAIPIIVMGSALEISKLVATVWLKLNWKRAPVFIRSYLLAAIIVLMLITSMGIFGFLSKAHSDQSLVSGDVQSKLAIYDQKIQTARENIDADRKQLRQMDEAVDQVMSRSKDERGANNANTIRKSQQKDRAALAKNIEANQKLIATLNDEAAPIRAEIRKVEAEVGPIKYIAAFVYGDNPDANLLEKAVTWVIIIIVSVFDPLAVILLLASQYSFQWFRQAEEEQAEGDSLITESDPSIAEEATVTQSTEEIEKERVEPYIQADTEPSSIQDLPYLKQDWKWFPTGGTPIAAKVEQPESEIVEETQDTPVNTNLTNADIKEIKRRWKEQNPGETIHGAYLKKELGLIDTLPWEEPSQLDTERPGDYVVEDDSKKKNYIIKEQEQQTKKKTK